MTGRKKPTGGRERARVVAWLRHGVGLHERSEADATDKVDKTAARCAAMVTRVLADAIERGEHWP